MTTEEITVDIQGARVSVPKIAAVKAFLQQIFDQRIELPALLRATAGPFDHLPAIGEPYRRPFATAAEGTYAGISLGEDGKPVALVLLAGELESGTWDEACTWAGQQGGALPSRVDQLVLFKNLKSEFKGAWYWSGQQYEPDPGFAWFQSFGGGLQSGGLKSHRYRARAVRRLPIE